MLINLTNHNSDKWDEIQKSTAINLFGEIYDINFPAISPESDLLEVREKAEEMLKLILVMKEKNGNSLTVHISGEFTFTYIMLCLLKEAKIPAVCSTTVREVIEETGGIKKMIFKFVKFREFYKL